MWGENFAPVRSENVFLAIVSSFSVAVVKTSRKLRTVSYQTDLIILGFNYMCIRGNMISIGF